MNTRHVWPYRLILILVGITQIFPILVTLVYTFTTGWVKAIPSGWTMKNWVEIFTQHPDFWLSMKNSLIISLVPIVFSSIIIILAMYTVVMSCPKLDGIIQGISMIPFTLKGVVLSISVIGLYAGKGLFISNRLVMLICSYCVVTMPYIYRGIRNSLYSIHVHQMVEAAELLGASRLYAFFRVVVPNMWTGVIVSFLLSFSCIFCDYAMISLILGSRFVTAQMKLYAMISSKGGPLTSAVVIIIFTTTFLISVLAYQFQKQTGEAAVKTTEE
jgi:putative spermidine/putrescine transport system permease protein